jgi:NDP-sugar pyrophosphorylase family protein
LPALIKQIKKIKKMEQKYHSLTKEEINQLKSQGCTSCSWSTIQVTEQFDPGKVTSTKFSGNIKLGVFDREFTFFGGVKKPAGISNATIHNCIIGNNVYIGQIKNYIANYIIEDDVVIENVDIIAVEGESSFGNGVIVEAINEGGGREIPIYDYLSAHTAYILALYRHKPKVINAFEKVIADYTKSVTSSMGLIARDAKLLNCRTIINVKIGVKSTIEGIYRLSNGSINSSVEDPVYLGPGVIVENFIICSGSKISDATLISNCFIGQGCELSKHYSAENSLFFANCQGFHGEACAIFAGPYTVSHHKSTLLIAGLFSFLNAGSGSNQSNHMYKLGPIHQGIIERGSKTTSDSYILWPAKIGAFSLVMGRHYRNSDTSDLPFSYLVESKDESVLNPGMNLRSVGTVRDAQKWPKRDKRKDPNKLDYINFNLLSPYTIQKMIKGNEILNRLKMSSGESSDHYFYQRCKIFNPSLNKGIRLYEIGINKFLGNSLIKRLEKINFKNNKEIQKRLKPDTPIGTGKWVDLAGLIAPEEIVGKLLSDIENEKISTLEQVDSFFKAIHDNYYTYEWTWAVDILQKRIGKEINEITSWDIIELVEKWKKSVEDLDNMLYEDAKKEFSLNSKTGFGMDGEETDKQLDFEQVRGKFESNSTVSAIKEHIIEKTNLGNELIERMKKVS